MGPNKTEKAIFRASQASTGIKAIVENFDGVAEVKQGSSQHTHRSSLEDELKILEDLREVRPFTSVRGRAHRSFRTINGNPFHLLNKDELSQWLLRHKTNIMMGYQGELGMYEDGLEESDESDESGEDGED